MNILYKKDNNNALQSDYEFENQLYENNKKLMIENGLKYINKPLDHVINDIISNGYDYYIKTANNIKIDNINYKMPYTYLLNIICNNSKYYGNKDLLIKYISNGYMHDNELFTLEKNIFDKLNNDIKNKPEEFIIKSFHVI